MAETRKVNRLFGEQPYHQEAGLVRWRYLVKEEHFNPAGALHGGVLATLLDGAMGHAAWTVIGKEGLFSSAMTLNVSFLRAVRAAGGTLTVEGRLLKRGKRVTFTEGVVTDESGAEIARATCIYAILGGT